MPDMTSAVAAYVHGAAADTAFIEECTESATALVDRFIGSSPVPPRPPVIPQPLSTQTRQHSFSAPLSILLLPPIRSSDPI